MENHDTPTYKYTYKIEFVKGYFKNIFTPLLLFMHRALSVC